MKKYFLFDCETGGINTTTSLLTLYGFILDEKLNIEDTIDLTMKPDDGVYRITAEAMKVNNIDLKSHDKKAITIENAAKKFEDFICKYSFGDEKLIPTGHNVSLDIDFCNINFFSDCIGGMSKRWLNMFSYRALDTASLVQGLILSGKLPADFNLSLKSLAEYFNLNYSGAHNAKFDVQLTLEVLKLLVKLM